MTNGIAISIKLYHTKTEYGKLFHRFLSFTLIWLGHSFIIFFFSFFLYEHDTFLK